MGTPVDFESANFIMAAPEGQEDIVYDLPVFKHESGMVACVHLTDEEIAEIVRTKVVWLHIMSHRMPPMLVTGDCPVRMPDGRMARPILTPPRRDRR